MDVHDPSLPLTTHRLPLTTRHDRVATERRRPPRRARRVASPLRGSAPGWHLSGRLRALTTRAPHGWMAVSPRPRARNHPQKVLIDNLSELLYGCPLPTHNPLSPKGQAPGLSESRPAAPTASPGPSAPARAKRGVKRTAPNWVYRRSRSQVRRRTSAGGVLRWGEEGPGSCV